MKFPSKTLEQMESELDLVRVKLAGSVPSSELRALVEHWDESPQHAAEAIEDVRALVTLKENDHAAAARYTRTDRADVYRAIDAERAHQDRKYGPTRELSLAGYVLLIEAELAEVKHAIGKGGTGRNAAMPEVVQVAACAVAALEKYGCEGNPIPLDDAPPLRSTLASKVATFVQPDGHAHPITFNINDLVWVKLTEQGEKVLTARGRESTYLRRKHGYTRFQLWHLIEVFGPHVTFTGPMMFSTDIIIGNEPHEEGAAS